MSIFAAFWGLFMAFMHSPFFWPVFEIGTILLVWFALIRPALKSYQATAGLLTELDNATRPMWSKVLLFFKGMWTAVLTGITGFFAILPDMLDRLTGVKWEAFFDPATVTKILAGISLAATVIHVWEQKQAAAIVPQSPAPPQQ